MLHLRGQALEALELLPQAPRELVAAIAGHRASRARSPIMAMAYMDVKPAEKQEILETVDVAARMDKVSQLLAHRIEVLRLSAEIGQQTKASLDERQREVLLREQMAAIQKQLGEGEEGKAAEMAELDKAIAKAEMPEEVEDAARKELRRLQRMPEAAAEYGMVRTYLDWLIELPWKLPEEAPIDIAEARRILDDDHYGLAKIKRRIIEYLAVRKLAPQGKAPILCFVGPPGVGKTSLGQSIARAMGRKFVRVSLGGVHDEAEIRGHRRTYIGALPGNIIQAIRKAGTRNCVMMLDEIDKLGARHPGRSVGGAAGGARSGAEQHLPRQLSRACRSTCARVVFIATANMLDTIPGPLRDRMEIISLAGYTDGGEAADRQALSGPAPARGERPQGRPGRDHRRGAVARSSSTTRARPACAISSARSARRCAMPRCASPKAKADRSRSTATISTTILGAPQFENEVAMRTSVPGVATGLAWTPVGGDILFIEATRAAGPRQADPHRPARRRDEGERAGGAEPGQEQGRRCSASIRSASRRATSTSTCRRAPSRRTGRARASPCSWRWPR